MTEETLSLPHARNYIFCLISLCKAEIALFSALSAVSGLYLVSSPSLARVALVAAGVLLMASGAGSLNHYQERHTDARMPRTAKRPLPSGKMKPAFAAWLSAFLIGSGAVVLCFTKSPVPPLLGLAAVFWYNGFYTWLKTRSPFAAIPGAVVGAIPPAIGWSAGGGHILDIRLIMLCFFFFIWQVLHFFVHMLTYAAEYEKAGLQSLSTVFTEEQIKRLTFQWLLAVAANALLIGLFDVIHSLLMFAALAATSFWLVIKGAAFIMNHRSSYADLFRAANYYILLVMTLLTLDGYFHFSG